MPRQTKQQKEHSLLEFVVDFINLIEEKFPKDSSDPRSGPRVDQHVDSFMHNGKYYMNFQKSVWSDGFTEYYIERYSKNIFDREICKTKRDQRDAIHEWAFIYPKGMNKTNGVDKGTIIGDWSVSHYSRKGG